MAKILKRTGAAYTINDTGETVPADGQLTIDPAKYDLYSRSDDVIAAIAAGDLVYNDGNSDLTVAQATNHIQGSYPHDFDKRTPNTNVPIVAFQKSEGTDFSRASHDWTRRTTWFHDSTRVTGESPSNVGLVYTLANQHVIDLVSGNVSDEDNFASTYRCIVYDDGVEVTSGITIDYTAGTITFDNAPSGAVTVDYSYESGSTYCLEPDAGKILYLEHSEIQFSGAVNLQPLEFQIWAYNPLFDVNSAPTADNPAYIPGVTQGENPLRFMVRKKVYKNGRDILNSANLGTGVIKAFGELTGDIQVFPFNYVKLQPLRSSQGLQVRLKISNDTPFGGEFATVTFYCFSEDE